MLPYISTLTYNYINTHVELIYGGVERPNEKKCPLSDELVSRLNE